MNLFYVDSRQTGKTTKLVNELYECIARKKEVYFFCANHGMCKNVISLLQKKVDQEIGFVCQSDRYWTRSALEKIVRVPTTDLLFRIGKCPDDAHVLVDEYLFFNPETKSILYKLYSGALNKATWTIRTTSNKMYRKDIIELIDRIKDDSPNSVALSYMIRKFLSDVDQKDFDELWNNLLSEPSFKIKSRQLDMENQMSQEQFELEMLGRFLSD